MTESKDKTNGVDAPECPDSTEAEAVGMEAPPSPGEATAESEPPGFEGDAEVAGLRQKAAKADENWDLYLRTRAELENYRKRATRERQEAVRYAGQALVERLLPVVDSFEMALAATGSAGESALQSLQQGIAMVQSQLKSVLTDAGVAEIDAAGQVFDPNFHEAVAHHESSDVPEGHVLHQVRKGYRLHDRLVRPAAVVVAKQPKAAGG